MDHDMITEKVLASVVTDMEAEQPPSGWFRRAIHDGILSGFRHARDVARIKRMIAQDAARIRLHVKELLEWDIGDDGATAAQMQEIAERMERRYGLTIVSLDQSK